MSFNGSGTFVINSTGNPVVTGTTISSTWANALTADLATGLSTTVCKDGQSTTTGVINFAAGLSSPDNVFSLKDNVDATKIAQFQLSGITTGTTRTYTLPDVSATLYAAGGALGKPVSGDLSAIITLSGVGGTANAITAGAASDFTLSLRQAMTFVASSTNTGATAIVITPSGQSALASKAIFANGVACIGGEIIAGSVYTIFYDGTQFQLIGTSAATGSFTATLTGCTTAPTVTVTWGKVGQQVVLDIPTITATSNSTAVTLTGLPAALRPATSNAKNVLTIVTNNGVNAVGFFIVQSSGVIKIWPDINLGNFANGTFAATNVQLPYLLT